MGEADRCFWVRGSMGGEEFSPTRSRRKALARLDLAIALFHVDGQSRHYNF